MYDKHLIETLLEVQSPWEVRNVSFDAGRRRCDVWVDRKGSPRKWLMPQRDAALPEKVWRHFNLLNRQTWIHLTPPLDAKLDTLPWAGGEEHCFTHAMAGQLLAMMDSGLPLEAVCRIMDISVNDLWRYKYALERHHKLPPGVPRTTPDDGFQPPQQALRSA